MNEEVILLKAISNCPVVQVIGRKHPGMVLQGDTLYSMFCLTAQICKHSLLPEREELNDLALQLRDMIENWLAIYEQVLPEQGLKLPYFRSRTGVIVNQDDCSDDTTASVGGSHASFPNADSVSRSA